jgi:hypothetical protein
LFENEGLEFYQLFDVALNCWGDALTNEFIANLLSSSVAGLELASPNLKGSWKYLWL